jgi:galactokinase/mevalonate kinase-like predicted kinase
LSQRNALEMSIICLTLAHCYPHSAAFPQLVLDIESVELGIAAGLQDRVVQTYGGLVHMDFQGSAATSGGGVGAAGGKYTSLDPSLLPELYLVYNIDLGGYMIM